MWIHIWGQGSTAQETINHGDQTLKVYPSLRCYIFERQAKGSDPTKDEWVQREHLGYFSLFLGLNHPLIGHVDNVYGPHPQHLPLGRSGYVYISHDSLDPAVCNLLSTPADWVRLPVSKLPPPEPALAGFFGYKIEPWAIRQTPMWFVPRLIGSRSSAFAAVCAADHFAVVRDY